MYELYEHDIKRKDDKDKGWSCAIQVSQAEWVMCIC